MGISMIDTTHEGIWLAEEAVRDIAREANCTRADAALIALDGINTWSHGDIPRDLWDAVTDAATSHLRAICR
jgi:hypothetical protein